MTVPAAGLEGAIKEALEESQFPVDTLETDLATFDAELATDDATEEPSTAEAPTETSGAAEEETPADVPDSFWGTDLTGIPAEKRAEIIAHLEQQEGTIRKLQAKLAEPLEVPQPTDDAPADEVTDEQLLAFLGIDPEDFAVSDSVKAASIKMARNQLALEDQVSRLTTQSAGREAEAAWNKDLDDLEATYGEMPGTREEVLRYALREEVSTPADLYFKLTAPVKREVESLAAKARREAGKRDAGGNVKPRQTSADPAPVQPGMSMRDAVKAAAMAAQKETGLSWKTAVKRVLLAKPEGSE